MRTIDEAEPNGFAAPTGGTALKVAGIGWGIMFLGGMVLKSIHPLAPLFTLGLGMLCGLIAVVLGVLSLFGVGKDKVLESTRPIAGVFGILLGGVAAALPLLLLPALNSARAAAELAQFRNDFVKVTGANPNVEYIYCAGGKLKLTKPSYRWMLADTPAASKFNPIASAAAMTMPEGSEAPVTAVLIDEEITPELQGMILEEYAKICGGYLIDGGFQKEGKPRRLMLDDTRCLVTTYRNTAPGENETVLLHCFSYGGHFVQFICSGPSESVEPAASELISSIELLP